MSTRRTGRLSWVTDNVTGIDHAVSDDAMTAGAETGRFIGLCGALFGAAALIAPLGGACLYCRAVLSRSPRVVRRAGGSGWRAWLRNKSSVDPSRLFAWRVGRHHNGPTLGGGSR